TAVDVRGRRSAVPEGAGNVVMSMTRKRRRVTGKLVLLTILLRRSSVPKVELFAGSLVKSRIRFGGDELFTDWSRLKPGSPLFCCVGLERFSGPGAPRR